MLLVILCGLGICFFPDYYVISNDEDNIAKTEIKEKEQLVDIPSDIIVKKPKTSTPLIAKEAYAIVVGISDYPGTSADLSYSDDDARAVYSMLINDYNFKPNNIIYLEDSRASKWAISNALDQIAGRIDNDDMFFFYYSGHGGGGTQNGGTHTYSINSPHPYPNYYDNTWSIFHTDAAYMRVHFDQIEVENGYDYVFLGDTDLLDDWYYQYFTGYYTNIWSNWIPLLSDNSIYIRLISDNIYNYWGFQIDMYEVETYDGTNFLCSYDSIPNTPSNYYLDTLLDSKLDNINCAEKFVVLDACNTGGMIPEVQEVGRYIMSACKYDEFSLESSALQHGVFTNYFLKSLDYASDSNGDGVISMEESYSYIYSNTVSYSGSLGYTHHPEQYDGISGPTVLYPTFGSVTFTPSGNSLSYSFDLYGSGLIEEIYLITCNISQSVIYEIEDLTLISPTATGFGSYSGSTQLEGVSGLTGYGIYAEINGNKIIYINNTVSVDSDSDSLDDVFEIALGLNPTSNDTDSDGLSDAIEFYGDTDPLVNDTDNDGLLDGLEVLTYFTNATNPDTDGDGLIDGDEILIYFTSATDIDTEGDGMDDYYEVHCGLDPLNDDSRLDYDNDGLNNLLEYQIGSFANDSDSDNDNMPDYYEYICNLDLLTNDANSDKDHDGLSNLLECQLGSSANDIDSDDDLMPDGWEYANNLSLTVNDANLDSDNDRLSNLEEFYHKTDPQDSDTDNDGLPDGLEVTKYKTDPTNPDTDGDGYSDGLEVTWWVDPLNPRSSLITAYINISGGVLLSLGCSYTVYSLAIKKKYKNKVIPVKKKFSINRDQPTYNVLIKKYKPKPRPLTYQTKPSYSSYNAPKVTPNQMDVQKLRNLIMFGLPKPKPNTSIDGQRALALANMAFDSIKKGNYINAFDMMISALVSGVPEPMNSKLKLIILDLLNRNIGNSYSGSQNTQSLFKKCPWCGHLGRSTNKYCYHCGRLL